MRMAGPDIVLFVVGALLFGGATYALVQQGGLSGGSGGNAVYTIDFATRSSDLGSKQVGDFGSTSQSFDVTATNVSKVTIKVACTDTVPGGTFQLQVKVEAPNGLKADPKNAQCGGTVTIDVPVASVPASTSTTGSSEKDAVAGLAKDANATKAVGAWKVTVTGARGGAVPGLPAGNPSGSITLAAETWDAKATPVVK